MATRYQLVINIILNSCLINQKGLITIIRKGVSTTVVIKMFPGFGPNTNCSRISDEDLSWNSVTDFVIFGCAMFIGNLDTIRHGNPLAVLFGDIVALWHCHVMAFLMRNTFTFLSVVVRRLAFLYGIQYHEKFREQIFRKS